MMSRELQELKDEARLPSSGGVVQRPALCTDTTQIYRQNGARCFGHDNAGSEAANCCTGEQQERRHNRIILCGKPLVVIHSSMHTL